MGLDAVELGDQPALFFSFVPGIWIHLEREQQALGRSGLSEDDWMAGQEPALAAIAGSGRHPMFARMLTTLSARGYDLVPDKVFELGPRSLLPGSPRPQPALGGGAAPGATRDCSRCGPVT